MTTPDPGSFRDPASRIVLDGKRVLRLLDDRGLTSWQAVQTSDFYKGAVDEGKVVESRETAESMDGAAAVLEHPRLALITYPYEWTFSMLRDAALLQLDLLAGALRSGLTIKDATPFNIQFERGRPIFIDVGSFEPYQKGEPWLGYRQFCRQFLYPLMLRAWLDVPFQPWLRGDMEGPTAAQMRSLLGGKKRLSAARLLHVSLQARLEAGMSGEAVRKDLGRAGFNETMILNNVTRLRSLVESLVWDPGNTGWVDYGACAHVGRDREAKSRFLAEVLGRHRPRRVVDLGANEGHYTAIAEEGGVLAVAVDGDEGVLDRLYRRHIGVGIALSDLANPSPSQGWAGAERPDLFTRLAPDLVVAYGVIHHLIYTASIPPGVVLDWLRDLGAVVALEYVSPDDEMVAKLTANKLDTELHQGRTEEEFRTLLADRFLVGREQGLGSGTRVLFEITPR
ncbi:MAG: methyltransferase [Actinobacteria bacterium]|nr:methyltransferase [Actinomycetota bacterium]MCI0544598.1 methyltransferase [Actinomycetota bacterium]MCI0678781.1 methyltransferase [Actinomycetota bacterium]